MRLQVKKWGNSAGVRIPASVLAAVALTIDQAVDVTAEGGRIIIQPVVQPVYELDALLTQMTPDTFQDDVGFGVPVGQEVW